MTRADVAPVKTLPKAQVWREIALPLSDLHRWMAEQGHGVHAGWARCSCPLAEILRHLDEMLMERPKLRRKRAAR